MASNVHTSPMSNQPLYEEISVIGNGAYGTVYKGYDLKTSRIVAMKRIRIQITEEGLPISTIREIAYLRHLEKYDHENIVKLLDVINGARLSNEQSVILIFEYIDYDLNTYLRSFANSINLAKIIDLMKQMLTGVDFLHINRIIHRDLKPQNILVTKEGVIKIADFGLARIYGFTMALTSVVVTLWYRSPEVLLHSTYSSSVDIWSLGCIFAELYLKHPLFIGQSDIDQLYKIFEILGLPSQPDWPTSSVIPLSSFEKNLNIKTQNQTGAVLLKKLIPAMDDVAIDLLMRLLDFNMTNRITAKDALAHSYFKQQLEATAGSENNSVSNKENMDSAAGLKMQESVKSNKSSQGAEANLSLSDNAASGSFQPNILKRKRLNANNNQNA